jgi:hypothetical protein
VGRPVTSKRVDLTGIDIGSDPDLEARIKSLTDRLPDASFELSGFFVRPGDTLIIRVSSDYTKEQFDHISAALQERLPGIDLMVLSGVEQIIAYRPGGDR